jgi:Xaa-Pro dipeptidase
MPTRRSFLTSSTLGAVAAATGTAAAQPAPPPISAPALPPSIASLTSMKSQARPITAEERARRLEKARTLIANTKLDALLLTGGASLGYFTGVRWWTSERFFGVVVPAKGEAFAVCPAFEEDRAREQLALGPLGAVAVLTWHEHEDPYALVGQRLREGGIATGRLGVEETTKFVFSDGIAKAAPALTLASGTPVTAGCRMIKDSHELELMRLAAAVTLQAYEAAWRAITDGMTQAEFGRLVSLAHQQLGFQGSASVQAGPYSALPHGSSTPQVLREGSVLLVDGGCSVEGYVSDISRTFIIGTPTDEMRTVFDVVHRAQRAALAAVRPGVPCEAVDAAARRLIDEAGYGPDYAYFTHRLGHGMGLEGHEWPYLVKGNTLPLAPGMTFSNEPGIYLRGKFGVRLEDDMVVTEDGAELFTPQSPSIEDPFGAQRG